MPVMSFQVPMIFRPLLALPPQPCVACPRANRLLSTRSFPYVPIIRGCLVTFPAEGFVLFFPFFPYNTSSVV
jgi:hypothetical protein